LSPSFFFQAEDGIRDFHVTGVQTCALPIFASSESALCRAGVTSAARAIALGARLLGAGISLITSSSRGDAPCSDSSAAENAAGRSEEHTSELQSRENLVCRLLLEKKKKKKT